MKKLVLIMISTLIFTSCSRDESNDKKVDFKDFLIGEWESDSDPGYGDPTFLMMEK